MSAGTTRVGAYQLIQRIGEGGMGSVWLAEHVAIGRRVAVKLLHPAFADREDIVTRFLNEARATAAIADPGIVQIFDFGRLDGGQAYIVMELLEGEPLDRRLQRAGSLAVSEALRIVRQIATALGAAHACGIVHRDLKPENIFLVRDAEVATGERAKLLDFGIAKLGERAGVKTQTHALMGTPVYMSPEQCRGAGLVDQRSDVYSLGCVLFALIGGRPPFVDEGAGELIIRHVTEPAPSITAFAPHVQANVAALIARCLDKEPARRFASGAELAAALGAVVSSISDSAIGPAAVAAITGIPSETTLGGAASEATPAFAIARRWWIGVAAVVGSVAAVLALRGDDRARAPHAALEPAMAEPPLDAELAPREDDRASAPGAPLVEAAGTGFAVADAPRGSGAVAGAPFVPASTVKIRIDSQPSGARVLVAGTPRGTTPFQLELVRGSKPLELELVRAGFLAHREAIEASGDREVVVVLKARPAPPPEDPDEIMKPEFGKRGGPR